MKTATKILYWTARVAFLVSFVLPVIGGGDPSRDDTINIQYGWLAAWASILTGPHDIFFWRALSNVLLCGFLFFPKFAIRIGRPSTTTVMIGLTMLNLIVNRDLLIGYYVWVGSFALSAVVACIGLDRPQKVVR